MIEQLRRLRLAALASFIALGLAACQTGGANKPVASATVAEPDGQPAPRTAATRTSAPRALAFESIDGPPEPVFDKLVTSLSNEAGAQRIPVASRGSNAPYRVRGYLLAVVENGKASVDWAWDVYDQDRERVLRVSGAEPAGSGSDVWANVDQAMLDRIAAKSLTEISTRLAQNPTAPRRPAAAEPAAPAEEPAAAEDPYEPIRTDDGPPVAAAEAEPNPALALAAHP